MVLLREHDLGLERAILAHGHALENAGTHKSCSRGMRQVGLAVGGEKDAKVIVDFRRSGEGGATAAPRMALFHGQSGGESFHRVDGGCGESFQMEAGMSGETFEVPALAFGVNGVERE